MINLIKAGAIAALATVGVIFGNVTASALETTPPAAPKITISTAQYKGEKNTIKFESAANDHYRFVITSGANKIQLRSSIRQELMQGSELSIEDLVKKYYPSSPSPIHTILLFQLTHTGLTKKAITTTHCAKLSH